MTFSAQVEQTTIVQSVVTQPVSSPLHNLDKIKLMGNIDAKPYLTGIFIECIGPGPNGGVVFSDIVDVPASETAFEDDFVLGAPVGTPEGANWVTGTYTFKLYWNPNNGPGLPLVATTTFQYQA